MPVLIIAVPGFNNGSVILRIILPKGFWGIIWLGPKIVYGKEIFCERYLLLISWFSSKGYKGRTQ